MPLIPVPLVLVPAVELVPVMGAERSKTSGWTSTASAASAAATTFVGGTSLSFSGPVVGNAVADALADGAVGVNCAQVSWEGGGVCMLASIP